MTIIWRVTSKMVFVKKTIQQKFHGKNPSSSGGGSIPKGNIVRPQGHPPPHSMPNKPQLKQVHRPIQKLPPLKKKPYSWQQKDKQALSNKYGITTYNVDGTIATMPQVRKDQKWWSEEIVEGEG